MELDERTVRKGLSKLNPEQAEQFFSWLAEAEDKTADEEEYFGVKSLMGIIQALIEEDELDRQAVRDEDILDDYSDDYELG